MRIRKVNPYDATKILTISEAIDIYMLSFFELWEKEEGGNKEYSLVYEERDYRQSQYLVVKSWCSAQELSVFLVNYINPEEN